MKREHNSIEFEQNNKRQNFLDIEDLRDDYFYGKLNIKINSLEELLPIMVNGAKKLKEVDPSLSWDEISDFIASWFDHDRNNENYFEHLTEDMNEEQFDTFLNMIKCQM